MDEIEKPINRGTIRQLIGKEYYIAKRRLNWVLGGKKWSEQHDSTIYDNLVFKHRSFIRRKLKDVDMHLQENKVTNLRLAISKIDNVVIYPGQTFSIWKLVGRPTRRKGYLDGLVLNQGRIDKGTGGGLCQLGNLLFWIFAHSPLDIKERYRHGFDVFPDINRKIPFGAGATLSYNYIDLQVKNNTDKTFQLKLWLDSEYLNGELLSDKEIKDRYFVEERNHIMKQQMWGGYSRHNQIYKTVIYQDDKKEENLLVENHAVMMYNPFLE
ncbi:MAG: VanW family protein [Bacteroidales bacterium]|jgi:vancomycin resistance protein VanW|nr:VanW family protein [Bacteroidales bacterium]